jgi:hypothetical protein
MPREVLPSMPAAGKTGSAAANTSTMQETLGGYRAPPTPDHLKPYRRSGTGPIGAHSSHYGKGNVFRVAEESRFGRPNKYEESTASRFAEMREPVFQPKTRAYASEVKEPLGKSMAYGYKLPTEMQAPEFRFGKGSADSEPVKTVMYPPEGPGAVPTAKEPMFQTQRGYDWAKVQIDPTEFRFGAVAKKVEAEAYSPTVLVPQSTVDQRKQAAGDIGIARTSGFAPPPQPNQTFGRTNTKPQETMKTVMMQTGDLPADLGTTTVRSATLRRMRDEDRARGADTDRCFGMPSIRSDKPPPALPKIASNTNYGNEPNANQLLFPAPDTTGASGKVLRSVDEAEALVNRCRFGLTRQDVARAFQHAERENPTVTAASFKRAIDDLDL